MVPSHLLAGPSSGSTIRRASLSPPGSAHLPRRGSSLRQTSSACDLIEHDDDEDDSAPHHSHSASSPTASESSEDDACDFQDHFAAPPSSSSSSSSLSALGQERQSRSTAIMGSHAPTSPKSKTCPAISASSTHAGLAAPASSVNSHKRSRGLAPLSSITATTDNASSCNSSSSHTLPKAQPLARALFARMVDAPHAGTGSGLLGGSGNRKGGKTKMIVATKPMRTTFELGLTSSELARRA